LGQANRALSKVAISLSAISIFLEVLFVIGILIIKRWQFILVCFDWKVSKRDSIITGGCNTLEEVKHLSKIQI